MQNFFQTWNKSKYKYNANNSKGLLISNCLDFKLILYLIQKYFKYRRRMQDQEREREKELTVLFSWSSS